jgi:hypothetical protein
MEHIWSVLCSRASIDRETNNISLFEVIEQIQVLDNPARDQLVGPFELVSLWARGVGGPERGRVRVAIRGPSGRLLGQDVQEIDLREFKRVRARFRVAGIPIEGPGAYYFSIAVAGDEPESWTEVAKIPLEVQVATSR